MLRRKHDGFTIVELLIVIVVIAILATITVVAYSGIQARTENSKTISAVGQYAKLLSMYAVDNSAYPKANYACLGRHPTSCARITGSTNVCNGAGGASTQVGFETEIKKVTSSIPQPSAQSMDCGGEMYTGAWYHSPTTGDGLSAVITLYLKGNFSTCPEIGGVKNTSRFQSNDTTVCGVALPSL